MSFSFMIKSPFFLITFFYLYSFLSHSQEVDRVNKYREDQFYIGFSLAIQDQGIPRYKQNGFSNYFHFGFIRDISLNSKGNLALGIGLGYSFTNFNSNLNLVENSNNELYLFQLNNSKNKFTYSSITFPIEFRWRTSTPKETVFWRIYGGLKYSLNFNQKLDSPTINSSRINMINDNINSLYLSMGYNTWNLYFEYDLDYIYKSEFSLSDGTELDVRALKVGLIFYLL